MRKIDFRFLGVAAVAALGMAVWFVPTAHCAPPAPQPALGYAQAIGRESWTAHDSDAVKLKKRACDARCLRALVPQVQMPVEARR